MRVYGVKYLFSNVYSYYLNFHVTYNHNYYNYNYYLETILIKALPI